MKNYLSINIFIIEYVIFEKRCILNKQKYPDLIKYIYTL